MNVNDYVGKRLLLKVKSNNYGSSEITEYKVLEVAPSGNWVKLMNLSGQKYWKPLIDISFIEVLIDFKLEKPVDARN